MGSLQGLNTLNNVTTVSDVLRERAGEPAGLQRMAAVSVLIHAAAVALIVVGAGDLLPRQKEPERTVMTISLTGGAAGVASGGLNSMGGREIQAEQPPDAPKRPEVTAPAAKTPEMTIPLPGKTPVKTAPTPPVKQAPDDARGRAVSRGAVPTPGSTNVETNVRGQGFGLSTAGGNATGGVQLDIVGDFCCPSYISTMTQRIRQNWDPQAETPADVVVKFTIRRDGTIVDTQVEKRSGYELLDLRAQKAVATTRQLPPLPAEFTNSSLGVHVTFKYVR
jgi:TonB family protein